MRTKGDEPGLYHPQRQVTDFQSLEGAMEQLANVPIYR